MVQSHSGSSYVGCVKTQGGGGSWRVQYFVLFGPNTLFWVIVFQKIDFLKPRSLKISQLRVGAIVLKRFIVVFLEFELVCPLLRYKDLRLIHLDIIGTDKYTALLQSLEQLAQVWCQEAACFVHCTLYKFIVELYMYIVQVCTFQVKEPTTSYPYFYSPGFRALEDGW